MKSPLLMLCAFFATALLQAQNADTTFVSNLQESGVMQTQQFPDRYDFVFGTHDPTRFLLKWNVFALFSPIGYERVTSDHQVFFDDFQVSKLEMAAEIKIAPAFSVQGAGAVHIKENGFYGDRQRLLEYRIEPRWYFNMPARIKKGKSADNLSGNYISVEYQKTNYRRLDIPAATFREDAEMVALRFGLQRRLFRYGYFDASAGVGHRTDTRVDLTGTTPFSSQFGSISFNTRLAMGFAFGAPRSSDKTAHSYCDVFRCFQEDRRLFKIDLLKLVRMEGSHLVLYPQISYECKIGASPFSLETTAYGTLLAYRTPAHEVNLQTQEYSGGISIEPRYYFLQKRRIANGKTGNNLSGIYAGINAGLEWIEQVGGWTSYFSKGIWPSDSPHAAVLLGIQHRIFKNGYINYKFGIVSSGILLNSGYFPEPSGFLSDLRMGLAF